MKSKDSTTDKRKPRKKTILLVVAVILLVLGIIMVGYGTNIMINNQKTDSEGYALSNTYKINSSAYVFALWMKDYGLSSIWRSLGSNNFAQMEYIVRATDPSKELFVGYARAADAGPYLGQGIMYETPTSWHWEAEPYYASIEIPSTNITNTAAPPRPPQDETFWLTSAHSNSTTKIYYLPLDSMYTLFIMNPDGSKNIQAELQIGFKVPVFTWLPYLLIPLGLILVAGGAYLVLRRKRV